MMEEKKDQQKEDSQSQNARMNQARDESKNHSGAFKEPLPQDQKSTFNSEEADLEQERKNAGSERD